MRLFMSYHTPDYEAARRVVDALKAHKPGLDIYFAPRVNLPGAYWVKRLADEIESSDGLLYLAGERVGAWQELEYTEAFRLSQEAGRGG
ncbi:MAG TPA: TIR domain-containing protein, partial [Rhodomicrobium sp.]|nr:TIR domain-containing protein [Rhodomicrobium sp.]